MERKFTLQQCGKELVRVTRDAAGGKASPDAVARVEMYVQAVEEAITGLQSEVQALRKELQEKR